MSGSPTHYNNCMKREMEKIGALGLLPFVVSLVSVFRMNVRGHFENSIVHSFQNVDFKMCMCLIDVERL